MLAEDNRVPQELYHFNRIQSLFDPEVINLILRNTASTYERELKKDTKARFCRADSTQYSKRLSGLMKIISEHYTIEGKLILYIDKSNTNPAKAYPTTKEQTDNYVVISESLIEILSDDELLFILGHEVSHIRFHHAVINWIIGTIYPEDQKMPPIIRNEWNIWSRLSEVSADNAGLQLCGDKSSAQSALRKTIPSDNRELESRISCLESSGNIELYYKQIIDRISEDYSEIYANFFEKAFLLISELDGHVCSGEEEFILNRLSFHKYLSDNPVLRRKKISHKQLLKEGKRIAEQFPDKTEELFLNLSALTLKDSKLTQEEYRFLYQIGTKAFGFTPEKVDSLFLSIIRSSIFQPHKEL